MYVFKFKPTNPLHIQLHLCNIPVNPNLYGHVGSTIINYTMLKLETLQTYAKQAGDVSRKRETLWNIAKINKQTKSKDGGIGGTTIYAAKGGNLNVFPIIRYHISYTIDYQNQYSPFLLTRKPHCTLNIYYVCPMYHM